MADMARVAILPISRKAEAPVFRLGRGFTHGNEPDMIDRLYRRVLAGPV
ncbi:MAG TPA: hypothetical protein PKJ37_07080 [Acidobacteriota bacterium]|nr:hypothetical protein [Acidobacteriota bacterium]HNT17640.1 hypothetical protein [Acidobacteriota bacterium]